MNFTGEEARLLLSLLAQQLGKGPIDFDSVAGKEIQDLLQRLDAFLAAGGSIQSETQNFEKIKELYEKRMKITEVRGELLDEEDKTRQTLVSLRNSQINQMIRRM